MPQKIFVIGATGYLGAVLAQHFISGGHHVSGLARSTEAELKLGSAGITPVFGDLDATMAPVLDAARAADVVVYTAQVDFEREPVVMERLCGALEGTGKTLIFTSGSGVFMKDTGGDWVSDAVAEDDAFDPVPFMSGRVQAERVVRDAAETGLRSMVVRPPAIWGPGDNGQVARVYRTVAATGAACYIGSGLAVYSSVHHDDLARLYSLAIERGTPGALYHATGGEFSWRWIAESVARDLGVSTKSLTVAEAHGMFGPVAATIYSACSRSLDPRSRGDLGWSPTYLDMLSQVGEQRLRALAEPDPTNGESSSHAFPGQ